MSVPLPPRPLTAARRTGALAHYLKVSPDIRVHSRYARRTVTLGSGYCPPGSSGRKVFEGPLVEGPWCGSFAHAVVISAYVVPSDPVIDAEIGDEFLLDGKAWVLTDDDRYAYPVLKLV